MNNPSGEKQAEIAYALVKMQLLEKFNLPNSCELKKRVEEIAKETGISKEELIEFLVNIIEEMSIEATTELRKIIEVKTHE